MKRARPGFPLYCFLMGVFCIGCKDTQSSSPQEEVTSTDIFISDSAELVDEEGGSDRPGEGDNTGWEDAPAEDSVHAESDDEPLLDSHIEPDAADVEIEVVDDVHQVLFIGNSLILSNNLPGIYEDVLLEAVSDWSMLRVENVSYGGYQLHLHADNLYVDSTLNGWLISGSEADLDWDYVVLQEQSQIPGFPEDNADRIQSLESVEVLSSVIRDLDAVVVLLMTWGYRQGDPLNLSLFPDYLTMQEMLADGYRMMVDRAQSVGAETLLVPVGLAFQQVYVDELEAGNDPADPESVFWGLYSADGHHPGLEGSYLAANVLIAAMTRMRVDTFSYAPEGIEAERAAYLRHVAQQAVEAGPCGVCPESEPICNPETAHCVACIVNGDCPEETPVCDALLERCVGCSVSADCTEATHPICSNAAGIPDCAAWFVPTNECEPCRYNCECIAVNPLAPNCNQDTGACTP